MKPGFASVVVCLFCVAFVQAQPATELVPDGHTVALWHLDGNGNDSSGNGNHLTVKEDRITWVPGALGLCVEMGINPPTGSCWYSDGGALTAPGSGCTYPGSGDWTLEAWVRFPSNSGGYDALWHYSQHWAAHDPYVLGVWDGRACFQINNSATVWADVSDYVGVWVHIAGVYHYQQDLTLYVNGRCVATQPTTEVIEYLPGYDVFVGGTYCGMATGLQVDEVRISNVARQFVVPVQIDIKPGSYPNSINKNGNGVIPVAILGSADFDVTQVDPYTLDLAGMVVKVKNNGTLQCALEDVNLDGFTDLVCQFADDASTWTKDTTLVVLTGNLKPEFGGTPIEGSDEVRVVP